MLSFELVSQESQLLVRAIGVDCGRGGPPRIASYADVLRRYAFAFGEASLPIP